VIAVDQDPMGIQGSRTKAEGALEIWSRPLSDGSRAVVLFNRSNGDAKMAVQWSEIGFRDADVLPVRDLWSRKDMGTLLGGYSARTPAHGVVMIKAGPLTGRR